jgi:hypothetical protein
VLPFYLSRDVEISDLDWEVSQEGLKEEIRVCMFHAVYLFIAMYVCSEIAEGV